MSNLITTILNDDELAWNDFNLYRYHKKTKQFGDNLRALPDIADKAEYQNTDVDDYVNSQLRGYSAELFAGSWLASMGVSVCLPDSHGYGVMDKIDNAYNCDLVEKGTGSHLKTFSVKSSARGRGYPESYLYKERDSKKSQWHIYVVMMPGRIAIRGIVDNAELNKLDKRETMKKQRGTYCYWANDLIKIFGSGG